MPLLSVVMPCYNGAPHLAASIDSLLAQSFVDWELLFVDDASTDHSATIVADYAASERSDHRIHLLRLERRSGVAAARNRALAAARGRYLAFLDADDLWLPDKLSRQLARMERDDLPFLASAYYLGNAAAEPQRLYLPPPRVDYRQLLRANRIGLLTVLLDRVAIARHAPDLASPDGLRFPDCHHEDYALWLRLCRALGSLEIDAEPLAIWRRQRHSLTGSKLRSLTWQWQLYRHVEHLPLLSSLWYLGHYSVFGLRKHLPTSP